jgi:hypothetical protein
MRSVFHSFRSEWRPGGRGTFVAMADPSVVLSERFAGALDSLD